MVRVINILAAIFCLFASIVCFVSGNIGSALINFILAVMNMTLAMTLNSLIRGLKGEPAS